MDVKTESGGLRHRDAINLPYRKDDPDDPVEDRLEERMQLLLVLADFFSACSITEHTKRVSEWVKACTYTTTCTE